MPTALLIRSRIIFAAALALLACAFGVMKSVSAADWSNTEIHIQQGTLDNPSFAGGGDSSTTILTFQHASGWKYGDNFFFVDYLDSDDGAATNFNNDDFYGEWYSNFSIGKIRGTPITAGPISDVGIIFGLNLGADPNVRKFLPGVRLSWNVPGFAFFNTDITAYIDDSGGVSSGGAPSEDDSFMIDFNWARPFTIGNANFSVEGHIEYIGERDNEFGGEVSDWILGQPQFRWYATENLALGIEYQFWINKLGDEDTDESAVQALLVWKF